MTGIDGEDLRLAYWISTHRSLLRKIAFGIGWFVVSCIWIIVVINFIKYIAQYKSTQQAFDSVSNTSIIYDSIQAPVDLKVLSARLLYATAETSDAYAVVENPNKYYVGRFSYTFTINGENYTFTDGVVEPNEQVYVVAQSITVPSTASINVATSEVQWQRTHGPAPKVEFTVDKVMVGTVEGEINPTTTQEPTTTSTGFVIPETKDVSADTTTASTFTNVTADLTNSSAYGFRQVVVTVLLRDVNNTVVGIDQQSLNNVASFSTQSLRFNWQRRFEFNSTAEVVVATDYWNRDNLLYPGQQ